MKSRVTPPGTVTGTVMGTVAGGLAVLLSATGAWAQSDGGAVSNAPDAAATTAAGDTEHCVPDTVPADRAPTVSTHLAPESPHVGDRVLVTYRFRYRARDRVEYEPDVVAFQQPGIEMDYARDQPERDRSVRSAGDGWITTDVVVAVQPFRAGDVSIRPQPARLNTGDEIARVCTPAVHFRVRSVFGNFPHPMPRDVTPPVDVRRDALTTRYVALGLDGAFVIAVGTLAAAAWSRARPRPVVPPPPPRHPFVVAMESLDILARSDLLTRGLPREYYDALSDIVRRYVGGMRRFDAIDMTTYEILATLRKDPLQGVPMVEVERLLSECDLVKFARYVPTHEECEEILKSAYSIVARGRPVVAPAEGAKPATAADGAKPAGGGPS